MKLEKIRTRRVKSINKCRAGLEENAIAEQAA